MSEKEEALKKAMDELDELEKSVPETKSDELDELTKSLEEELGEDLSKSQEELDEDLSKSEKEEEKEEKKEEKEEEDKGGEPEPIDKSQDDNYDEELVKASEAFASLEKSVSAIGNGLGEEIYDLKKSLAALLNLNIKQAKVIASLAKSRNEDMERIEKSMSALGSKPVIPGQACFGLGAGEHVEELAKSISEISELLTKAVQEKKVDARYLSIFGTTKDVGRLPDDVKKIIGL
jgi:Mg2+ and Co2+ transporter CorA